MIGETVSHYRILEKLGEGGMGVVYKAEDTKLERVVALKFLTGRGAGAGEKHTRFLREARAAAALSHANICTVFAVEEIDGRTFIAMEFVAGRTLQDLIETDSLSIDQAVDLVAQVAAGLREAHAAGIVHRDIKPANIMITPQGQAKILDFGLARSAGAAQLTQVGAAVGTAAYMSPEQARGDVVDQQTDIWSLGVVLYELLTGRQPFRGDHPQALIYSILNEDPEPVRRLRDEVPARLEKIVGRALAKSAESRYRTVADLLDDLIRDSNRTDLAGGHTPRRAKSVGVLVGAVALVVAAVTALLMIGRHEAKPVLPAPVSRQVTFTGTVQYSVLSPGGEFVSFINQREDGGYDIAVKDLESKSVIAICSTLYCVSVLWSPDETRLLFAGALSESDEGCYLVPRLGGDVRKILDSPWVNTAWSPDGQRIAYVAVDGKQVRFMNIASGAVDSLPLPPDVGEVMNIQWCPSANVLLIHADDARRQVFWAVRADGGAHVMYEKPYDPTEIIKTPAWSADGRAVYFLQSSMRGQMVLDLLKVPIDPSSCRVDGDPEVVWSGLQVQTGPTAGGEYSLSRDERRLLFTRRTTQANLWLASVEGNRDSLYIDPVQLTTGTAYKSHPRISPDGRRVVFAVSEGDAMNIFLLDLDFATRAADRLASPRQLTYQTALNDHPAWSPDGQAVVYLSTQSGVGRIWRLQLDGGAPQMLPTTEVSPWADVLEWSPGPAIIYRSAGLNVLSIVDPVQGEQSALAEERGHYLFAPRWSPDGSQIALFQNIDLGGRSEMGLWLFSADGRSRRKLAEGFLSPISWTADGAWIYVWWGPDIKRLMYSCIARVPVAGGPPEHLFDLPTESPTERYSGINMTPDGRTILFMKDSSRADAWLVENFDSSPR